MNLIVHDQEYLKSLTVLYVEDDEVTREQFAVFLNRFVGKLVTAKNGLEGVEAFQEHRPQIVITDIQMPVMDGLTMAAEIRCIDESVPIIVLTAFEEVDYLKNAINVGVNQYLTKPVNGLQLHELLIKTAHSLLAEKALQTAARIDLLTGLANRRELVNRFNAEKARAERHSGFFSVIIADIDHFKNVNDCFGHIAGDRILEAVADTIARSIRSEDICGRWGGEEFLIILPQTDLDAAAAMAERLRYAVNILSTEWDRRKIRVTISLGVGQFSPGMNMDECIRLADDALYRAKAAGRNRVELA